VGYGKDNKRWGGGKSWSGRKRRSHRLPSAKVAVGLHFGRQRRGGSGKGKSAIMKGREKGLPKVGR